MLVLPKDPLESIIFFCDGHTLFCGPLLLFTPNGHNLSETQHRSEQNPHHSFGRTEHISSNRHNDRRQSKKGH
jgi:hypothetical protein